MPVVGSLVLLVDGIRTGNLHVMPVEGRLFGCMNGVGGIHVDVVTVEGGLLGAATRIVRCIRIDVVTRERCGVGVHAGIRHAPSMPPLVAARAGSAWWSVLCASGIAWATHRAQRGGTCRFRQPGRSGVTSVRAAGASGDFVCTR